MQLLLMILSTVYAFRPSTEAKYFGDDYRKAVMMTVSARNEIQNLPVSCQCDSEVALSVVFPEFLRYNSISNLIETEALELLYVQFGTRYADFSIGTAQMKPSFAEDIEVLNTDTVLLTPYITQHGETVRRERLVRLQSFAWQYRYVCAFLKVLAHRFPDNASGSAENWVQFAAAAYNLGFMNTRNRIEQWQRVKAFPYGKRFQGEQFSYSYLALHHYLQHNNQ